MNTSKKRPRADGKNERNILSDPKRQPPLPDRQSDVPVSNPPHQNEEHYTLPEPPVRTGPKPVSSNYNRGDNRFGTLVSKYVAMNEYEHEVLSLNEEDDEVRLLILRQGEPCAIIQCRFLVLRLDHGASYEALSYHWSTELADREIKIENLDPGRNKSRLKKLSPKLMKPFRPQSFYIRPNLHKALTHHRDKNRDIVLWVDALCINQEDEREKTVQVPKMARIYSRGH